jgi:hypothetical protein
MFASNTTNSAFKKQLNKVYTWYTGGFIAFVCVLAVAEQMGLTRAWIGYIFLAATVLLYAGIGVMSRTNDAAEYYVAGRRVPALYTGMATGADWMSAASFIGMAGTLYLTGYSGLAFIMGWTGGYCLVALFLAPYLRKFGQFTIPDFLGERYDGNLPRLIGTSNAAELLYTGRFIDAARALRLGLVSDVVPEADLVATGRALAEDMVATAPLGLRLSKEAFWASVDAQSLDAAIAMEDRNQILTVANGDLDEGIAAFLEKRKPQWGKSDEG